MGTMHCRDDNSFARNHWYLAAWLKDLPDVERRLVCGIPIVLVKTDTGQPFALKDWCPHRGVPLSLGRLIDGAIECPYHGLRFDRTGRCVFNPHVRGDPGTLRAARFPTRIHQGGLWVWPGDPVLAETRTPPAYPAFDDQSGMTLVAGYLHIKANVQLIIDNLLDLSHAQYIHAGTIGTKDSADHVESRAINREDGVTVTRRLCDVEPSNQWKPIWHKSPRIDQVTDMTFHLPSVLYMETYITVPGGTADDGFRMPFMHILTPETERSTHYHFLSARNFLTDDVKRSTTIKDTTLKAFSTEDAPILEAIQRNIDAIGAEQSFANFTPGDAGSRRARKLVAEMIKAERMATGHADETSV